MNWIKRLLSPIMVPKREEPPDILPLWLAWACEDCGNLTRAKGGTCDACGSRAIWQLVTVLEKRSGQQLYQWLEKIRVNTREVEESLGL